MPMHELDVEEGQAHAGEDDKNIIAELENVDNNATREEKLNNSVNDGDEEDEDDDDNCSNNPVPDEWNMLDKVRMEAMHNHHSRWEYGSNMIHPNQVFHTDLN